jgi:hypothetical protein
VSSIVIEEDHTMGSTPLRALLSLATFILTVAAFGATPDAELSCSTGASEVYPLAETIDDTASTIAVPASARQTASTAVPFGRATSDPAWQLLQTVAVFERLKVGERLAVHFDAVAEQLIVFDQQ